MPKVSVIVPIYNSVDYLAECLACIERQTLEDIEILCVDDASSDASASIYKLFAEDDSRYRIISFEENRGSAAARNAALDVATGDYVAFMDDDDWYAEDASLEILYRAAVENEVLACGGLARDFDNRTSRVVDTGRAVGFFEDADLPSGTVTPYREWQGDTGLRRFLFKRSLIEDNQLRFTVNGREGDSLFLVRALVAAEAFYAVPDVVYYRRTLHHSSFPTERELDDTFEGIVEKLVIAQGEDLQELKARQAERLKLWSTKSLGLILNEEDMLKARSRFLQGFTRTRLYRQAADIAGSYKTFASEALNHFISD